MGACGSPCRAYCSKENRKTMTIEVEIRSREEKYRGKSLASLKLLGVRESAQYIPSRSRRSVLRHFDIIEKFVKSCEKRESEGKKIRTHERDIVIVPQLVGKTIGIYNGTTFQ